jgi:hypothetical protein
MNSVENAEHILTQILEAEKAKTCGQESRHSYFDMHKARFADIMRLCQSQVPNPSARVLDITHCMSPESLQERPHARIRSIHG